MGKGKSKGYDVKEVEARIKEFWEKEKIYKFNIKDVEKAFSIDNPPPTVSGKMHIGHAFQYSQQDFMARFHRMKDGAVFYPFGTDDNGLPTERLIEKLKNVKSKEMSRADFIKLCLETLKQITEDFIEDWKKIGISSDYDLSYSTIDDNSRKLSQKFFIELFKKGKIFKKEFPTIWCPECQTAIAQAELEDKEKNTLFSTIKFKVAGKDLLIATTRPELLGACVAIFVHPDDKRYKKLVGKEAEVPLFMHKVPILADKSAEPEKGTGVLMICSYGDKFDVDAINRHKLEPKLILDEQGRLTKDANQYVGMGINEARKKILEDLEEKGLITEQKQISHVVNTHDKCGNCIEFITTDQWFVEILDKRNTWLSQGKKVNWLPDFMYKRYENWVKGLEWDWSISRDRHFGIPIPVWYCGKCDEIIVPEEKELPVDPIETKKKCNKCGSECDPEKKVLDTWATSSITPQICMSLVDNKIKLPFSLRNNAHDIIRTWDFYTIVRSYYHENKLPWKEMMVSGFVTLGGEKMSKSTGNVIAPQQVLEEYGADTLRFWAAGSKLGNDLDYQEQDIVAGKKFLTKLWNATKFVFMNLEDYNGHKGQLEEIDEEFLVKINSLIKDCSENFKNYEYSKVKNDVDRFFWASFADNYLEIVKDRIYNAKGSKKTSAQYVLYESLFTILKLMAPITPFITEEIYQLYFKAREKHKSIHLIEWPKALEVKKRDTKSWDKFIEVLGKIRQAKADAQKSVKAEIILTLDKKDLDPIRDSLEDFKAVTSSKEIKEGKFKVEFIEN